MIEFTAAGDRGRVADHYHRVVMVPLSGRPDKPGNPVERPGFPGWRLPEVQTLAQYSSGMILPISDGKGSLLRDASFQVLATIWYPNDAVARRSFLESFTVESAARIMRLGQSFEGELDTRMTARLMTAVDRIMAAAARDGQGSEIAGELLLIVLNLAAYAPHQASLRRARDLFSREQTEIAASERPLKQAWSRFKSVAHLAGALRLHHDALRRGDEQLEPMNPATLPNFLAVAEALRIAGTRHRPPIGRTGSRLSPRTTLDPAATWRTPSDLTLPTALVGIPSLTDYVTSRLRHYSRHDPS